MHAHDSFVTVTNQLNIGAVMERGIRLIGCGQAPVQKCKYD
jgi:hypothetical protein